MKTHVLPGSGNSAASRDGAVVDATGLSQTEIELTINGQRRAVAIEPFVTLLDLIRERFQLTGTKKGCDHGQCGACTILLDGVRVNSCLILAITCDGSDVTTIEGLCSVDALHEMQAAFIRHDALQCGYCTPGQIISAVALIEEGRATTRSEIREAMSGNLCRCGAYQGIVDAIEEILSLQSDKASAR